MCRDINSSEHPCEITESPRDIFHASRVRVKRFLRLKCTMKSFSRRTKYMLRCALFLESKASEQTSTRLGQQLLPRSAISRVDNRPARRSRHVAQTLITFYQNYFPQSRTTTRNLDKAYHQAFPASLSFLKFPYALRGFLYLYNHRSLKRQREREDYILVSLYRVSVNPASLSASKN